jgi:hypothetical protein
MELVQPTFRRCLAIWWSFAWRAFVLWTPVMFVVCMSMLAFVPFPEPGTPPDSADFRRMMLIIPIMWLVIMGGLVVTQTYAMQWMLRTQRWRDWFVALIPADDPRRPGV